MAPSDEKSPPSCHVVAMSYPGRGHINPTLNLCKVIAERSSYIHITIVVTEEWLGLIGSIDKPPNISFATIPNVVPSESVRADDINGFAMAVLTKMGEPFERLLDERRIPAPDFVIADALLPWAGEAADRRNIPVAYLWTMSATAYAVFNNYELLGQNGHFPIDLPVNGDGIVDYIPGVSPIRVADLPPIMRNQEIIPIFLNILPKDSKGKSFIFNSIYELESQVFNALKQKLAFSIFNIGPATEYFKLNSDNVNDDDDYLKWLDLQPPSSVLYVSLGSFLSVSTAQLDEIVSGLKESGVRFLWVARRETSRLQDTCGEKGLVVAWCDQLRVLSHPSVGGYWSHCGWSSTKEALLAGVPMLTSPIIMDQLLNAKFIVDDWRIGWRLLKREFNEENLVKGDEIAELVKRFMDLECHEREELTRNAKKMKNICEREFASGQSFETNLDDFVQSILQCGSLAN